MYTNEELIQIFKKEKGMVLIPLMSPEAVAGKYLERYENKSVVLTIIQADIKKPGVSALVIKKLLAARDILNSMQ